MASICYPDSTESLNEWSPGPKFLGRPSAKSPGWASLFTERIPRPSPAYSKRSHKLAGLRSARGFFARELDNEEFSPVALSLNIAEQFLAKAPEWALDFDFEYSDDGEVNAFYGRSENLFHIFFDPVEGVSYYGRFGDREIFGDDLTPESFPWEEIQPYLQLL